MSKEYDGGPAFPVHGGHEGDDPRNQIIGGGMTLRQHFAGIAMHALILNPSPNLLNGCGWDHIIAGAYQAADKMLAESAK